MNALASARRAAGMSQDAAARLIGRTQSHYSKIERGAVRLTLQDAAKLAAAWNLSLSQLLTDSHV